MTEDLLLALKLIRSHSSWISVQRYKQSALPPFAVGEEITLFVRDRLTNDFRFSQSERLSWIRCNKFNTVVREQEETLIDLLSKTIAITLQGLI